MTREPALLAGVSAAVASILAALVAFGVDLTQAQTAAVLGVVGAVGALVASLVTRKRVTPVVPAHRAE